MSIEKEAIYREGYAAYFRMEEEHNPYEGIDAEYWSDGWTDAEEDNNGC